MSVQLRQYSAIVLPLALAVWLEGCGRDANARDGSNPAHGTRYIIAVDVSGSRSAEQLQEARNFAQEVINTLHNGDQIVLMRVYEYGMDRSAFAWSDTIKSAKDSRALRRSDTLQVRRVQREAQAELPLFFDESLLSKTHHTDIISTLHHIADRARVGDGRRTVVYLVSDMLHSTPELNLERALPPPSWLSQKASEGLIPSLAGVCLVAIGPNVSTHRGVAVRGFWQEYARAAGTEFRTENYRHTASSAGGLGCSS